MTSFEPDLHPRVADGTFSEKRQTPPALTLTDEQIPTSWIAQDTPFELAHAQAIIASVRASAARSESEYQQAVSFAIRAFTKTHWPAAKNIYFAADGDRPSDQVLFLSIQDEDGVTLADHIDRETELAMLPYARLITNPYNDGELLEQEDAYGTEWRLAVDHESRSAR
jgi:hypothetical protein